MMVLIAKIGVWFKSLPGKLKPFMTKAWTWLKKNWHVVLLSIAGIIAGAMAQSKLVPKRSRELELESLSEGARAAERALKESTEVAVEELKKRHEKTLQSLSDAQAKKVELLQDSPQALARYLVRVGKSLPSTDETKAK